ncbi:hypothetical protein HWV62_1534 [Athelia sp. TMB]|nr:hypothetical protein HWV62_1534 [Athelia sp. TMB]
MGLLLTQGPRGTTSEDHSLLSTMATRESVAIFWDYENLNPSHTHSGFEIVRNIREIAHQYGDVKIFKAYQECTTGAKNQRLRSEFQCAGVSLTDCPHNGGKEVADRMLAADMLAFAIDVPAPATIILITNDRDFVYAVSLLRLRQYRVILVGTSRGSASLKAQASVWLDWVAEVTEKCARRPESSARGSPGTSNLNPAAMSLPTPPPSPTRAVHSTRPATATSYFAENAVDAIMETITETRLPPLGIPEIRAAASTSTQHTHISEAPSAMPEDELQTTISPFSHVSAEPENPSTAQAEVYQDRVASGAAVRHAAKKARKNVWAACSRIASSLRLPMKRRAPGQQSLPCTSPIASPAEEVTAEEPTAAATVETIEIHATTNEAQVPAASATSATADAEWAYEVLPATTLEIDVLPTRPPSPSPVQVAGCEIPEGTATPSEASVSEPATNVIAVATLPQCTQAVHEEHAPVTPAASVVALPSSSLGRSLPAVPRSPTRPVPTQFSVLVAVLREERRKGNLRVNQSTLAHAIYAADSRIYKRAGISGPHSSRQLLALAVTAGVVTCTGNTKKSKFVALADNSPILQLKYKKELKNRRLSDSMNAAFLEELKYRMPEARGLLNPESTVKQLQTVAYKACLSRLLLGLYTRCSGYHGYDS